MNLHRTNTTPDWESIDESNRTYIQRLAHETSGVVTPANLITLIGLFLVVVGLIIYSVDRSFLGVGLIIMGRVLDVVDGLVADATKTKSPLGEFLDASVDKIILFIILGFAYFLDIMPVAAIVAVALPASLVTLVSYIAKLNKVELHPSRIGKISTAVIWISMVAFMASGSLGGIYELAVFCVAAGATLSFVSLYQYARQIRLK